MSTFVAGAHRRRSGTNLAAMKGGAGALGPAVERLLTLDKFKAPFEASDAIERIYRSTMIDFAEGDMAPGAGGAAAAGGAGGGAAASASGKAGGGEGAAAEIQTHFDPTPLLDTFEQTITFLHEQNEKVAIKVKALEEDVKDLELTHEKQMKILEDQTSEACEKVEDVEYSIKLVSSKVVHVGEQLNAKKQQRERAQEARTVMEHFAAFKANGGLLPPFSTEKADLHACAAIIQKLNFISSQLKDPATSETHKKIKMKYDEIEKKLLKEFGKSLAASSKEQMRAYAHTLYPFDSRDQNGLSTRGYSACVSLFIDSFIEREFSRQQPALDAGVAVPTDAKSTEATYAAVESVCNKAHSIVMVVFRSPRSVMARFVQKFMESQLHEQVTTWLEAIHARTLGSGDEYLDGLHSARRRVKQLLNLVARDCNVVDPSGQFQEKMLKIVFEGHMHNYVALEESYLEATYDGILDDAALAHGDDALAGKSSSPMRRRKGKGRRGSGHTAGDDGGGGGGSSGSSGGVRRHRRSSSGSGSAAASATAAAPVQPRDPDPKQLLSMDIGIAMIHENQRSLTRCRDLVSAAALPGFALRIFTKLMEGLGTHHIVYSLERAASGMLKPRTKFKGAPAALLYFYIVRDANSIVYFLQKHFWEYVLPAVRSSVEVYKGCVVLKNETLERMELLLASGLDAALNAVVSSCEQVLSKEQTKSDFKPADDSDAFALGTCSQACKSCVTILKAQAAVIADCLNGQNLEGVLLDLAKRIHKALLSHFKSITVNELGGMLLARDLQEYIECISIFKNGDADALFQKLREASAVLMVPPANLRNLRRGQMAGIDTEVLVVFAKMRNDWKSAKLAQYFVDKEPAAAAAAAAAQQQQQQQHGNLLPSHAAANLGR